METTINRTILESMRREKIRQERAAEKQAQEEIRQLKVMLTPMLEWFAENGDLEMSIQAKKALHDWSNPAHRAAWEAWAKERGYFAMVASAVHDRKAFTARLRSEHMQAAPPYVKALSECALEAARKLTSPQGIGRKKVGAK